MNSKRVISAILAISLSTGGIAFAQGNGDRNDSNDRGRNEQMRRGEMQRGNMQRGQAQDRGGNQRGQNDRYQGSMQRDGRNDERGAGPSHQFHKGERLPLENRNRQYVVDDWRSHRLSAPPRGYHWVQTGGDYVLVAIATGIIMQLFLNH